MKKLPKIYQNELKNVRNNKEVFDSLKNIDNKEEFRNIKEDIEVNSDNLTVMEKIKNLIHKNNYIFNTKVILVFSDYELECEIAGIVNNHIITMDNQIIKIDMLKDIKILK